MLLTSPAQTPAGKPQYDGASRAGTGPSIRVGLRVPGRGLRTFCPRSMWVIEVVCSLSSCPKCSECLYTENLTHCGHVSNLTGLRTQIADMSTIGRREVCTSMRSSPRPGPAISIRAVQNTCVLSRTRTCCPQRKITKQAPLTWTNPALDLPPAATFTLSKQSKL